MSSLPLSFYDLEEQLDPRYLGRGEDYYYRDYVETCHINPDGRVVSGLVRGSGARHYKVHVVLRPTADGPDIEGHCSCPVGDNCKHVAALLVAALDQQDDDAAASPALPGGPDHALNDWLRGLHESLKTPPARDSHPPDVPHRLLYVLRLRDYATSSVLEVAFQTARALKAGGYGKASGYNPAALLNHDPPRYLLDADIAILQKLNVRRLLHHTPLNQLSGADSGALLAAMLATGRCHWEDKDTPPLMLGETRRGEARWQADETGRLRLALFSEPVADRILPTSPPWYIDIARQECGPLDLALPEALVPALLQSPAVMPEQVAELTAKLEGLPLPPPPQQTIRELEPVTPRPVLTLFKQAVTLRSFYQLRQEQLEIPAARLEMDYAGRRVAVADSGDVLSWRENNTVCRRPRDRQSEHNALTRLEKLGLAPLAGELPPGSGAPPNAFVWDLPAGEEADAWIRLMLEYVPALRQEGWQVEVSEDFPFRIAEVQDWTLELDEGPQQDWFDLDLGIQVDGERVSLLPILMNLLRQFRGKLDSQALRRLPEGHRFLVPLEDGRLLPLPGERVAQLLGVLVDLFDPDALSAGGRLSLPALRAAELAELEDNPALKLRWLGGERVKELARRLRDFQGIQPVAAPKHFTATLRPYQQAGLDWLQFLREYGLNGILADDMGLGKTVQALAHIMVEKNAGRLDRPCLVVAPTSLMVNWSQEAARFAPTLKTLVLHGPDRARHFDAINDHELVLTTYPLLGRDEQALAAQPYHLLILDEAQHIKNPKAKAARVAQSLDARHRLCLTGTPLENHLGELWSLFHFLMPGLLGDERQFRRLFRTPIEKQGHGERAARLAKRVAPFLLRRTKEDVASELPPKTEIVRSVPLAGGQRDLYESIRLTLHEKVRRAIAAKGLARSHIIVLDALLKLRQACCDPRLVKVAAAQKVKQSAKLELLLELLPELLEEGRRVLLFSQFTSMLSLIEAELKQRGIGYVKLTGQTRDRKTPIRRFQDGEVPLFLISLKAGGTGLNLTAADTVIHYDPWWNPAVEAQASDRAHRIGQDKPVFVYKLITEGTVEERIQALQAQKRHLAEGLFEGAGKKNALPAPEDLEALFEPL
ncbi:MAG TPA: helicase SNF2 [Gammaproteobacteria bacterium]|nr:helicase SNF2 [Gammaproteobacteria bacterium]